MKLKKISIQLRNIVWTVLSITCDIHHIGTDDLSNVRLESERVNLSFRKQ